MKNLLKETIEAVLLSGHKVEDIVFIGSEDGEYECSFEEFKTIADKEYDHNYGHQEVASDLVVIFSDGQRMSRCENDGHESWQYSTPFKRKENPKPISSLMYGCWSKVSELN